MFACIFGEVTLFFNGSHDVELESKSCCGCSSHLTKSPAMCRGVHVCVCARVRVCVCVCTCTQRGSGQSHPNFVCRSPI